MLDISTISAISAVVAAIGVIAGVVFTVLELRNLVKQRQTDLITKLYSIYAKEKFQKEYYKFMTDLETNDYATFRKKYAVEVPPIGLFLHEIGILLRNKLIDIGLVSSLFGGTSKRYWERVKPIVEDARRQLNQPRWGGGVEYLYNEIQKRREQRLQQIQQ